MATCKSEHITVVKMADIFLGVAVMGTVGGLIGIIMGEGFLALAGGAGLALGGVIGFMSGRRFLLTILVGTLVGGVLAWGIAGPESMSVGAGAGAAMGGFLGIQISTLLDLRATKKSISRSADLFP